MILPDLLKFIKPKQPETKPPQYAEVPNSFYCQACGKDITDLGGMASSYGSIFCQIREVFLQCYDVGLIQETMLPNGHDGVRMTVEYKIPMEVKEAIRFHKIIKFGPLERKVTST